MKKHKKRQVVASSRISIAAIDHAKRHQKILILRASHREIEGDFEDGFAAQSMHDRGADRQNVRHT